MAVPVFVTVSPRFELFLALAQRDDAPETWLRAAGEAGDFDAKTSDTGIWPRDLPGGISDETKAATLRAFLSDFQLIWDRHAAAYAEAAARLTALLDQGPGDLGAAFGFALELDPRRRGLRQDGTPRRLAPNRLSAIHLLPSAFNPLHFWHLGTAQGGRHAVYLPCHDAVLAAAITDIPLPTRRIEQAPGDVARIFAALGDASRLAMAQILARETLSAAELGRRLDLSPPAISYHLGTLREAGLVSEHRQGASLQLSLRRTAFANLGERVLDFLTVAALSASPSRSRRRR
jgi:DNA-binding transcriptional ArsR family regulator